MSPSVAIIGTRGYPSYYGGFETAVRKLAPYLVDHGWDVTVYGRPSVEGDDPTRDLRVKTRTTLGIDSRSLSTLSFGFTASFDALLSKFDVVLVMNVANGFFLPFFRVRHIPTLVNVDGMEWKRAKWGVVARWLFRAGAKLTARWADQKIFDSVEIGRRWSDEFGVDGKFIPYGGEAHEVLPIEEGLVHRGYILMVARLVPENSVSEFLEAAEVLCRRWPVVVVGSSGYGDSVDTRIQRLSQEMPNFFATGQISDDRRLWSLWQHAGAYFHGHSVGGTNPALVQAMASGAPIVARDTVFNREVLGPSGSFARPTAEDIIEQITLMMADPTQQERAIRNERERVESRYTWDYVCSEYELSLKALLKDMSDD